jgi:hypothetical protein
VPCAVAASAPVPTELARNEWYQARVNFAWVRADYNAVLSSKMTALLDKVALPSEGGLSNNARSIDPSHAFAQVSPGAQVATPAADPLTFNRPCAVFANAQYYDSTLSAAAWKWTHDGTGSDADTAFYALGTVSVVWATLGGTPNTGVQLVFTSTTNILAQVYSGANPRVNSTTTRTAGFTYVGFSYGSALTPNWQVSDRGVVTASGAQGGAPSAAAPVGTMRIGANLGAATLSTMRLTDVMWVNSRSAVQRAARGRYMLLRNGLN